MCGREQPLPHAHQAPQRSNVMQKALMVQPHISTSKIGVDKSTPYAVFDLKLYFCDDLRNAQVSRAAP